MPAGGCPGLRWRMHKPLQIGAYGGASSQADVNSQQDKDLDKATGGPERNRAAAATTGRQTVAAAKKWHV